MSSISDILAKKSFVEPPEMVIIKEFVMETFNINVAVSLNDKLITIHTPSSAMAGALRPHLHVIKDMCQTQKKLIIRVG
jgi:hypothetical protein